MKIAALLLATSVLPAAWAADVTFDPTVNASYYRDGNVQIVSPDAQNRSDGAVRVSVALPLTVRAPLWSFRSAYAASGRMYDQSNGDNDISHSLGLGYDRTLSERNNFAVSASATRTEDQRVEPDAPDQPITFLPRTVRTGVSASVSGSNSVSPRSGISWSVGGATTLYDNRGNLPYEDYVSGSAGLGWSYQVSERSSSGVTYRYGLSTYDTRPDATSHAISYAGSTSTRRDFGIAYSVGVIATDVGDGEGWYTNGGANVALRWNPRPDHSLSAGVRQDVSPGRGVGGATLDRGAYVGWGWSHPRGLGVNVVGGYWDRSAVQDTGESTRSLYVSESVSWGFGSYLRVGVFHAYRDQTDTRSVASNLGFQTSYHSYGINVGWRILGDRGGR